MNLKITQQTPRLTELGIEKGKTYEIDEEQPIVVDMYKIKAPMKRKGKFRYALIADDEGELLDEGPAMGIPGIFIKYDKPLIIGKTEIHKKSAENQ